MPKSPRIASRRVALHHLLKWHHIQCRIHPVLHIQCWLALGFAASNKAIWHSGWHSDKGCQVCEHCSPQLRLQRKEFLQRSCRRIGNVLCNLSANCRIIFSLFMPISPIKVEVSRKSQSSWYTDVLIVRYGSHQPSVASSPCIVVNATY